jgi:hypothetical protein
MGGVFPTAIIFQAESAAARQQSQLLASMRSLPGKQTKTPGFASGRFVKNKPNR